MKNQKALLFILASSLNFKHVPAKVEPSFIKTWSLMDSCEILGKETCDILEEFKNGSLKISPLEIQKSNNYSLLHCQNGIFILHEKEWSQLLQERSKGIDYTMVYVAIASSVLFSLVILIYLLLPKLRNIHGKIILSHLVCMLATSGLHIAAEVLQPRIRRGGKYDEFLMCWSIGVGKYFFGMGANAWLVVINFDLWSTFRSSCTKDVTRSWKKFFSYSWFGLGLPVFLTTVVVSSDLILPVNSVMKPDIGIKRCFLSYLKSYSIITFFYAIIGLMIAVNLVLFLWTNATLCMVQSKVAGVKKETKLKNVLVRLLLFFKLFCVMGVTFTISLTLWLLGSDLTKEESGAARFFQVFNVFHGICYFIVFVCKPSVFRMMRNKFGKKRPNGGDRAEATPLTTPTPVSRHRISREALLGTPGNKGSSVPGIKSSGYNLGQGSVLTSQMSTDSSGSTV